MIFNPAIHHRRSIRLRDYDYASAGAYFVTICTQGKECLFGQIDGEAMVADDAGRMVETVWQSLPERFPGIVLDEFVTMPNHVHFIIMFHDGRGESCIRPELCDDRFMGDHEDRWVNRGDHPDRVNQGDHPDRVNQGDHPDRVNQGDHKDRPYGTVAGSLGRVVQAFKSITTYEYTVGVKQSGWRPFPGLLWQRNYYERVVRDEGELHGFREYIRYNPARWANDDNHMP